MIKVGSRLNRSLFSSERRDWKTPIQIIEALRTEFPFTLDACATPGNTVAPLFFTKDGLGQPWEGIVWCNPPYGRGVDKWLRKGFESAEAGATVVFLLPARTDTRWFHEIVLPAAEIRFLRGRLQFGASKHGAPFPSMLAIFRPDPAVLFPLRGLDATKTDCQF